MGDDGFHINIQGVTMLEKFFGYRVELVEHSTEYTLVRAETAVPVGTQIPVRVSGANGRRTPSVPMVVISCRAADCGGFLLAGKFLVDHPDLTGLEIPPSLSQDSSARSAPRVSCHLCVLSRSLPGFRVMTVDISEGGLQVEAPSGVELGSTVLLRIEFDTNTLPSIEASAVVAWCRQQERGRFRIGLRFTSIDERSQEIIGLYRDLLVTRDESDISSRILQEEPSVAVDLEVLEPAAPLPTLNVIEWHRIPVMAQATLVGYLRAGQQLQVRLRGGQPGVRSREFIFTGLKGLKDHFKEDPSVKVIAIFRHAQTSEATHRFQMLDANNQVLLDIEAAACRESSSPVN